MTEQPARIALVSGFWGQNIGNAFFNIGGKWILEQAFPDARVDFIQDQPGYRTFHRQSKGNPRNDVGLLSRLKADAIVLQGPLLTRSVGPLSGRERTAFAGDYGGQLFRSGRIDPAGQPGH